MRTVIGPCTCETCGMELLPVSQAIGYYESDSGDLACVECAACAAAAPQADIAAADLYTREVSIVGE